MSNNYNRKHWENPHDDPADDDDLPSNWISSGEYEDEYDRYEDYVTETGHDPYRLFDEQNEPQGVFWLKSRLRGLWRDIKHVWRWHTSAKYRQSYDDIPF